MGFDVVSNVIGAGVALALGVVVIGFMAFTVGGRFGRAIKKHPRRAWEHLQAENEVWIPADDRTPDGGTEGLQGPYTLEMPDGTIHTFYGRPDGMDASMKRFLSHLPS